MAVPQISGPAPVEVEAPGIGVDLDRHAVLGAGRKHFLKFADGARVWTIISFDGRRVSGSFNTTTAEPPNLNTDFSSGRRIRLDPGSPLRYAIWFRMSRSLEPGICGNRVLGASLTPQHEDYWSLEMTSLRKTTLSLMMGAGVLAFSAVSAPAAIICNDNVCWHAQERYSYPPDAGVVVHRDNWRWGPREHFRWREHEGRGYWRGDRWREF